MKKISKKMVPICAALLGIQIVLGGCAKNSTDIQTAKVNARQAAETEVKTTVEETTTGEITTAEETSEAVEAAAKENMGEKELETEENEETKSKTEEESETEESTEPKSEPEPDTESGSSATVLFAGDICLEEDGFVLDHYDEVGQNLEACMSPYLLSRMHEADIFMLNHEYTISGRGSKLNKYYTFRANPSRMEILKQMGVDIVSLANNHIYDYGYDAFVDTLALLDENGIRHVGGGMDSEQAEKVEYYEINGIKIGFVAASRAEKNIITPQATDTQSGVFWMYDDTRLKEVVREASSQCDFLIAYLHWGTEDSEYFRQYQHNIAEELVECGVSAIIGGHPHVVQGMEFIGDVPILYSLGDFWFNGEDKYSVMVQLTVYKNRACNVEIIPCRQQNYTIQYLETPEEQEKFFRYLTNLSSGVSFG